MENVVVSRERWMPNAGREGSLMDAVDDGAM